MMRNLATFTLVLLLVPALAVAQTDKPTEGRVSGNYNIQQAVEVGGRITDVNGNKSNYNTFENLQSGPRLLEYTLSMRSLNHTGTLMDDLYTSSFGYGGDPNALTRLRISKNKWYDFTGMFRRDQYYFDYNLLANPLNPANSFVPNNVSPHFQDTRRKSGDFQLTLAPQSPIRFRLGYSRNAVEGPMFTSFHEGTDIGLRTNNEYRSDRYQAGIDVRVAPRTTVTFDQFWEHNKTDNGFTDAPFRNFLTFDPANPNPIGSPLNPGSLVDIGLIYYPLYGQPCGNFATPAISTPPTRINPACNIYVQYDSFGRTRSNIPTSQLSIASNYWKKLDITAQGSYSSGELKLDAYNEFARALVTRTNQNAWSVTGPARNKRVEAHADFGLTYHLNEQWSLSNQFRWLNWRIPGTWNSSETICFANTAPPGTPGAPVVANIFTPPGAPNGAATCLGFATAGIPQHNNSSPADINNETFIHYLGEASIFNTSTIEWEPAKRFAAHVGYRYGNRYLKDKDFSNGTALFFPANLPGQNARAQGTVVTPSPDDIGTEDLTEHALLVGFRALPYDGWRVNADLELLSASNAFTRITPRNLQKFKARSTYRVAKWGSVNGSINLLESRNGAPGNFWPTTFANAIPRHKDHARSYQLSFTINPKDWIAVDFGYDYFDQFSMTGTCVPLSVGRPGGVATPLAIEGGNAAALSCFNTDGTTRNTGSLATIVKYQNNVNSGFANVMVKPVKRLAITLGYDLTSDSGYNNWYRPDTGALLRLPADAAGNVVVPGSALVATQFVTGPNPLVPLGPLGINWHKPSASVAFEVVKGLTAKGAWNYFDYNEKALSGPVVPRDFRANTGTLSLRYEF